MTVFGTGSETKCTLLTYTKLRTIPFRMTAITWLVSLPHYTRMTFFHWLYTLLCKNGGLGVYKFRYTKKQRNSALGVSYPKPNQGSWKFIWFLKQRNRDVRCPAGGCSLTTERECDLYPMDGIISRRRKLYVSEGF